MIQIIKTFIIGIFVGIANVIPGVSGGTLIVVFNIYDKFVNAITLNIKKLIKNASFVIPILLGMIVGILIFSKGITVLYNKFPIETNFFFAGLIAGSIPLLLNYSLKNNSDKEFKISNYLLIIINILIGIFIVICFSFFKKPETNISLAVLPKCTFVLFLKLVLSGTLASIAMIIPGISGSLLLLALGVYPIIISSIPALLEKSTFMSAFLLIIPVGIGIVIGLFAGAKVIAILLKKIPNYTYSVITGLIIGSFFLVIPKVNIFTETIFILPLLSLALGFSFAFFSTKFSKD